ncbi:MAG: hypothetical protein K0S47_3584 [Herbinix sp.]|jgi:c-di-GMP-related signal transduction protein|nr:hypothetical protein [Herbinix sp.]
MIPIEKNIVVIDEHGKECEATYVKRAKGLVKKGRARFVNNNTICLVNLPNEFLEETIMDDNNDIIVNEVLPEKVTVEYILKQIETIRSNNEYLTKAVEDMNRMVEPSLPEYCNNLNFVTKAEGWRDIVMARETTNQKMISFYEKIYDDIKPKSSNDEIKQFVLDIVRNTKPGAEQPDYHAILSYLR